MDDVSYGGDDEDGVEARPDHPVVATLCQNEYYNAQVQQGKGNVERE